MMPSSIYVKQMELGPMQNFVYLIGDPVTKQAGIVDPAWNVDEVFRQAQEDHYTITHVFLTHGHYDHVNGVEDVLEKAEATVCAQDVEIDDFLQSGAGGMVIPKRIFKKRTAGPVVQLGSLSVQLLPMPGHTPGSQCILVPSAQGTGGVLFTGDFLFVGTIGRCDLPGSHPKDYFESFQRLKKLDDELIFYPGHDYGSVPSRSLGQEKKSNPYLLVDSYDRFLEMVHH